MPRTFERTEVNEEKFNSFKMPMLGHISFADIDTYEAYKRNAEGLKLDTLGYLLNVFNECKDYVRNYGGPVSEKYLAMMEELRDMENVSQNRLMEHIFYCIKDVSEDMRAEVSYSNDTFADYKKNKGNGFTKGSFNMFDDTENTNGRLLKLFEKFYDMTKTGDRFYRGSSIDYKDIQRNLKYQIERLKENKDEVNVYEVVDFLKMATESYIKSRKSYEDVNTYKGRRVNIMKNILDELNNNPDIKDVSRIFGEEKPVQYVPVMKKVKGESEKKIIVKPTAKAHMLVKNTGNLKKLVRSDNPFDKVSLAVEEILAGPGASKNKMTDIKNLVLKAETEFMKHSAKAMRTGKARIKDYEKFPVAAGFDCSPKNIIDFKGSRTLRLHGDKIKKLALENNCGQLLDILDKVEIKAWKWYDEHQANSLGFLEDFIEFTISRVREISSGITTDEYEKIKNNAVLKEMPGQGAQMIV